MESEQYLTPEQIVELRKNLGWTQLMFAQFLRVAPRTVQYWESGRAVPHEYQMTVLVQLWQRMEQAKARQRQEQLNRELKELLPKVVFGAGLVLLFAYLFKED